MSEVMRAGCRATRVYVRTTERVKRAITRTRVQRHAAKIILGETGALCRESDMIEVSKNQPRIAACEGCGGEGWEHCLRR